MPHAPRPIQSDDRISWPRLLAYGSGGIIPIALFNIAGQLMGLIGNIGLGLSAFWLGVIMIFPRLWDAVSDPVMGHLSDNTRTRWGRRRPYIFIGGLLVAISFAGMWWVPDGLGEWGQLGFILGGLLIFFTACTMFEIPHGALGMEMSKDPHERTRLFSSKSFFGNLFAMGTPWLLFFAGLEVVRGTGGTLVDGMRYLSMIIAVLMLPLILWWFFGTREPGYTNAAKQERGHFWTNMKTALSNTTFLCLVLIIFTLAMGFNFVGLFNYYISIYYLFSGDPFAAGALLGINGTIWAVTGLAAVFPLNWVSPRIGKRKTLMLAIGLMCAAQLSKIVCYNPELPYLLIIPTVLLSAGMLMFFTLGSSMLGDICDEDELNTSTRSEGSYYSVYWWFIKMGTAFASFVTGALLLTTQFDETQSKEVSKLYGGYEVVLNSAKTWATEGQPAEAKNLKQGIEIWINGITGNEKDLNLRTSAEERLAELDEQLTKTLEQTEVFNDLLQQRNDDPEHVAGLQSALTQLVSDTQALANNASAWVDRPEDLQQEAERLLHYATMLAQQSPKTLLLLRAIEIGLPLLLSIFSIYLTWRYPLTEERCYAIKAELEARHQRQEIT